MNGTLRKMYTITTQFFIPKQNIMLGRWSLKHEYTKCEYYIQNYYGEPGYPNTFKPVWVDKLNYDAKSNSSSKI